MLSAMQASPKRPRDPNQLGKMIVDIAVGERLDPASEPAVDTRDPGAVALGKKGGQARAERLSAKKRKEIARKAATARWGK
jgi:hypothetical protein